MKCEHCGEEKTDVREQKFDRWVNELYLCRDCSDWLYSYIINEVLQNLNINEEEEIEYLERIALTENVERFDKMLKNLEILKYNNFQIMRIVAHEGKLNMLKHLIETYKLDYKILFKSSACSNYQHVREYLKSL